MLKRVLDASDVAIEAGDLLGETPFWHGAEKALYWVDIRSHTVQRWQEATGEHRRWTMPDICTGVVPASDGGLVVALRNTIAHYDPETEVLRPLCEIEPEALGNRLNEMRCDRAGRLWIGSMRDYGAAVTGSLYRVDEDLSPRRMLRDIRVPNSLGWSPDNLTLYFADTADNHIRRYRYMLDRGDLGEALPSVAAGLPGGADGSAIDAKGFLWNARYGGGQVVRISPEGHVVEAVDLPVTQPAACAFGGANLDVLYITTAKQRLDEETLRQQPLAGHVFRIVVDTPGIQESSFRWPARH